MYKGIKKKAFQIEYGNLFKEATIT